MAVLLVACGADKNESPDITEADVNLPAEPTQKIEEQSNQCEHNWCPATAYWDEEYSNGTVQELTDNEYVCSICGQRAVFPDGYFNQTANESAVENTEPPVSTPNPNHEWVELTAPYQCADGNQVNIIVGYSCNKCGMIWYIPENRLLPPDVGDDHVHDWHLNKTGVDTNFWDSYECNICGLIDTEHGPDYSGIKPSDLTDEEILASTNRFANR